MTHKALALCKGEQGSCMGLGSSLQPVSRCKRGLQGIAAVLVSTEKPSLTGTSAQGAWMHQSHQAQSGSKQRVNSAPPSSAISEEREGEHPRRQNRRRQNRETLAQKYQALRAQRDRSEEGHGQAETPRRQGAAGRSPSESLAVKPTHSTQAQVSRHSPTPLGCKAKGTRRLAPAQHRSSQPPPYMLSPWGEGHQGGP